MNVPKQISVKINTIDDTLSSSESVTTAPPPSPACFTSHDRRPNINTGHTVGKISTKVDRQLKLTAKVQLQFQDALVTLFSHKSLSRASGSFIEATWNDYCRTKSPRKRSQPSALMSRSFLNMSVAKQSSVRGLT